MLYTGLDLHKSFSYITTMNDKGEIIGQKKLPSNGKVVEFLKQFSISHPHKSILCIDTYPILHILAVCWVTRRCFVQQGGGMMLEL